MKRPSPPRSRARALTAGILLAGVLVACSGDDDADGTDGTDGTDAAASTAIAETTSVPASTEGRSAAATTVAAATTAAVDGFTFTPPEGDYSIVFPAEPTAREQTVALPDGTSMPITFYVLERDDTAFGTAAAVYPPGTQVTLEGSRDGALANISGTLVESESITLQGRDGLQFSASVQGGAGTYLSRIYADGVRLYQVVDIESGTATFDDPDVASYFDSFRFTEGP